MFQWCPCCFCWENCKINTLVLVDCQVAPAHSTCDTLWRRSPAVGGSTTRKHRACWGGKCHWRRSLSIPVAMCGRFKGSVGHLPVFARTAGFRWQDKGGVHVDMQGRGGSRASTPGCTWPRESGFQFFVSCSFPGSRE